MTRNKLNRLKWWIRSFYWFPSVLHIQKVKEETVCNMSEFHNRQFLGRKTEL